MDELQKLRFLNLIMTMEEQYRDVYSTLFATNLAFRDILMRDFGMSKKDAEDFVVEKNEEERKRIQKAAEKAESERR